MVVDVVLRAVRSGCMHLVEAWILRVTCDVLHFASVQIEINEPFIRKAQALAPLADVSSPGPLPGADSKHSQLHDHSHQLRVASHADVGREQGTRTPGKLNSAGKDGSSGTGTLKR